MRKFLLFVAVVVWLCAYVVLTATSEHIWILQVNYQDTYDSRDIQFFELRRGAEAFLLSAPGQADIAQFLRTNHGKRIVLTLEAK